MCVDVASVINIHNFSCDTDDTSLSGVYTSRSTYSEDLFSLTLQVAFQDFVACMIMSESSMDVLNKRLEKQIPSVQFRPNLMIEGSSPFDEVVKKDLNKNFNLS